MELHAYAVLLFRLSSTNAVQYVPRILFLPL